VIRGKCEAKVLDVSDEGSNDVATAVLREVEGDLEDEEADEGKRWCVVVC
jgi:hypothetical protein